MTMSIHIKALLLTAIVGTIGLGLGERLSIPGVHSFIAKAEATVGRPLTPVSVAGVARRSAR
jgi:hypothetical protein